MFWNKKRRLSDDELDLLTGEALVDLVISWTEWCHRRVDSLHVLDGERGRRRHSIDCTPPPDPRLLVVRSDRDARALTSENGQMIIPLAFIAKDALRHFDARDGAGKSMPVLRSDEIARYQLAMLEYMFKVDGVDLEDGWKDSLRDLVGSGESVSDSDRMVALFEKGEWKGVRVWSLSAPPSDFTRSMISNFASTFLLLGLIDSELSGTRQVIKYSFHWKVQAPRLDRWVSPLLAIGAARRLTVDLEQPAAAGSYHFEMQTPDELECASVAIPDSDAKPVVTGGEADKTGSPVAHAHGSYTKTPSGAAEIFLRIPRRGLWLATSMATLFTASVVGGIVFLPWAKDVWVDAPEAATALLIAAPAVYFGLLLASKRETSLASGPLGFLRTVLFFCTMSLFLVAASIVGELKQPLLDLLLILVFAWTSAMALYLTAGRWLVSSLEKRRLR